MRIDPLPPLVAFGVSLVVTGLVTAWARRRGAVEPPDPSRRIHERPTPRLGGMGILAGYLAALHLVAGRALDLRIESAMGVGAALFFAVGFLDDLFRLPTLVKWLLQAMVAVVAVSRLRLRFDAGAMGPWPNLPDWTMDSVLTAVWIVAVVNLLNFLDGIDGILVATCLVVSGAVAGWGSEASAAYAVAVGSCTGFAVWNAPPARTFMGDGGSHCLGFVVAASACTVPDSWHSGGEMSVASAFLPWPIVGAALLPAILDVGEALIHKARNGIPLSQAHADHLYQRLVKAGWSHGAVALRYGLLSLAGVVLAGPVAMEAGLAWALVPGILLLVIHWATGIRATRAVPRLAKSPS